MNNNLDWKIKESKKVISAAVKKWWPDIGIAFTGRKDSSVVMHLILTSVNKKVPAMFIDHGLHFDESYKHIKKLAKLWNLKVDYVANESLLKKLKNEENMKRKREIVRMLKIKTIEETIRKNKWKALISAIRWDEQPARAGEVYFSKRQNHFRVHPILHFTEKDIWDYIRKFKIPYNPLYDQGYRSIGEKLFTKPVGGKNASERAGREKGKEEIMGRLRSLGYF
jgi:phosphoadenosine phosphosulfate reductase